MRVKIILFILIVLSVTALICLYHLTDEQEEEIKELEQALTEQIQEVEVYRGILEEYQIEGIINE